LRAATAAAAAEALAPPPPPPPPAALPSESLTDELLDQGSRRWNEAERDVGRLRDGERGTPPPPPTVSRCDEPDANDDIDIDVADVSHVVRRRRALLPTNVSANKRCCCESSPPPPAPPPPLPTSDDDTSEAVLSALVSGASATASSSARHIFRLLARCRRHPSLNVTSSAKRSMPRDENPLSSSSVVASRLSIGKCFSSTHI
jgi:hypothetical protein